MLSAPINPACSVGHSARAIMVIRAHTHALITVQAFSPLKLPGSRCAGETVCSIPLKHLADLGGKLLMSDHHIVGDHPAYAARACTAAL
jgi:hypothetical protein